MDNVKELLDFFDYSGYDEKTYPEYINVDHVCEAIIGISHNEKVVYDTSKLPETEEFETKDVIFMTPVDKKDNSFKTNDDVKEYLHKQGLDETLVFESPDYHTAVLGITDDGRLVYSYDKMIEHLISHDGFEETDEAMEFIDYNTVRAIPYFGHLAPVVVYDNIIE